MAMMASKGAFETVDADVGVDVGSVVRSVVEDPRRSPAEGLLDCVDWIWEAE
jgi:hypothetical protein